MVRRATQNCFVAWRRHVIAVHACQQSIRQRCDAKITLQKNLERLADISSNRWSNIKQHGKIKTERHVHTWLICLRKFALCNVAICRINLTKQKCYYVKLSSHSILPELRSGCLVCQKARNDERINGGDSTCTFPHQALRDVTNLGNVWSTLWVRLLKNCSLYYVRKQMKTRKLHPPWWFSGYGVLYILLRAWAGGRGFDYRIRGGLIPKRAECKHARVPWFIPIVYLIPKHLWVPIQEVWL